MRSTDAALASALIWLTGVCAPLADAQAVEQVQSRDLQALDGWQVGQAAPGDIALPPSLWRASDAATVGALIDKLSGPFPSPAATRLARAVLTTGGDAPAGDKDVVTAAARKRFAALGRFGAADEIVAMTSVSQPVATDPSILMYAAQADLARGRPSDACRRAQSAPTPTAFVLSVRAFCMAMSGQSAAADVALDVARAAGASDAWLLAAIPAINGGHGPAARFDTSFNAAVSIAAKLKPPPRALAKSSLLALSTVARSGDAPALLRAEAAEAALRQSAITGAQARDAYGPALELTPSKTTPVAIARLRAVETATTALAKLKAIQAVLAHAATYSDMAAAARLLHDDIAALPRDPSTAGAAWTLARANLAIGDVQGAIAWRDLAVQGMAQSPIGPQRAIDCAIVVAGGGDAAAAGAAIDRRLQFSSPRIARDAALMMALGLPAPARAHDLIAATPDAPTQKPADPAILADLVTASQRGAAGDTALLAARAIAPGAHTLDRASLVSVVQALRAVHLDGAARQVALEAMIGAGLE